MSKNSKSFFYINFLSSILLIGYLSIGFVPNWEAVDKIAPQWLVMSIINLVGLFYIYYNRTIFLNAVNSILSSFLSLTYIGFILWAGASYFYAINPTEVIVNITRQVNVLLMFLIMAILIYNLPKKTNLISWVITLILGIELYAVIIEAQGMITSTGGISSGNLKGITANRNITAFSIAIKIPFVLFLISIQVKKYLKALLTFFIFLSLFCLSMIQSRASFIAVGIIIIGYFLVIGFGFYKNRKLSEIFKLGFLVIPLILSIFFNQIYLSEKGADAISRAATISLSTNDGSVNQRLRYYEDVLKHMSSNPIFGVGIGNWKLKSIDYDSKDIVGYIVPYHAHSDFIQLGAELGIIGFFLYLGVFFWAVFFVYKLIRFSKLSKTEKVFIFFLLLSLGVYSVDANLNFPIARPQVLVVWAMIIALITSYHQNYMIEGNKIKTKWTSIFIGFSLLAVLPSIYVTNQVYKSLKGQMFLLQDFGRGG